MKSRLRELIIVLTFVLLSVLVIILALNAYPVPGNDAISFIPTAINFGRGNGLTNDLSPFFSVIDTTGQNRFLIYPPLFPLVLGFLLKINPTAPTAILMIALLNIVTLAVCGWGFYKISTLKSRVLNWPAALVIAISLAGVTTHFMGSSGGRPEILASLLVALGLPVILQVNPKFQWLYLGVLLGLLATTHPIGTIISATIIFLYYSFTGNYLVTLFNVIRVGLVAVVVALLVMLLFSPFSIPETLDGILKHASILDSADNSGGNTSFIYFFFLNHNSTFYGLALFLAFVLVGWLVWLNRTKPGAKWFFYPGCLLLLLVLTFTTFLYPTRNYNVFMFFPLFFAVNIYFFVNSKDFTGDLKFRRFEIHRLSYLIPLVVLLTVSGLVYDLALFPAYLAGGMPLDQARNTLAAIQQKCGPELGISDEFWYLSEDYKDFFVFNFDDKWLDVNRNTLSSIYTKYPLIVKEDDFYDEDVQAALGDFTLARNYIKGPIPKFAGLKLSESLPGYVYALYIPKNFQSNTCAN